MRSTAALFSATAFASAFLLFLVEPMVGKLILPRFGGAPAVWNTCMAFFQLVLLAGYALVHLTSTRLQFRAQVLALASVWALAVLSFGAREGGATPAAGHPTGSLLFILLTTTGLPFLALSTTAPLLQRWYAAGAGPARNPYPLYAASNAGSLLALLAYPSLVEPALGLGVQRHWWAVSFAAVGVLVFGCGVVVGRTKSITRPAAGEAGPDPGVGAGRRIRWLLLSFVPSALLLALTTYLSQVIAPVPLLWVLPLSLYLLSFILAFSDPPAGVVAAFGAAFPVGLLCLAYSAVNPPASKGLLVATHLAVFLVTAVVLHSNLARLRPAPSRLTEFYLWVSLGGCLGGCFIAFAVPVIFPGIWEYQLALVAAALLWSPVLSFRARPTLSRALRALPLVPAVALAAAFAAEDERSAQKGVVLHRERNFFGVLRVELGPKGATRRLIHGNVWHGAQFVSDDPRQRRLPLLYFFPTGPAGRLFHSFPKDRRGLRVGVVGLGAGTLASYGEPGDEWTFFEIDEAVERVARDPAYFTYLSDAEKRGVRVNVVCGDARLTLASEPAGHYRVLVLDAFSGDAIPVHLLTREAIELYLGRLSEHGLLAVHVTNDYLDLKPVFAEHARALGLAARLQDTGVTRDEFDRGKFPSAWLLLARREEDLEFVQGDWRPLGARPGFREWVDDYSNLLSVFVW